MTNDGGAGLDRRLTSILLGPAFWPAVAVTFLGGVALRVLTFFEPWTGVHNAWGGAFYGNVARNFVRYGYLETKFAPVVNAGVVDPGQFELYYHHPVLTMWVTSVSFRLFGIHEWAARVAPIGFSVLTMLVVFVMARAAFGRGVALLALFFMAIVPVDAYYAAHLDPYGSMALFFTTLAVEAYRRWHTSGSDRHFALCAIAIVLGCWTSWYTYLVVPGIFAHAVLTHRHDWGRDKWIRLLALPALTVVVFALFVVHRRIAMSGGRPEIFDPLVDRLAKRTISDELDRVAIMGIYARNFWRLFTPPLVALFAGWLVLFVQDLRSRRASPADWCIAILVSYGFLYALAFPGHLQSHDYFVRAYAPAVALAAAVALARLAGSLSGPPARLVVVGLILAAVFGITALQTRRLYGTDDLDNALTLKGFGQAVAAASTPTTRLFSPIRDDRVLQYYLDRPGTFDLDTPDKLKAATDSLRSPYLVIVPERSAQRFPELMAYLRDRYPMRRDNRLFIFQSGRSSSSQ